MQRACYSKNRWSADLFDLDRLLRLHAEEYPEPVVRVAFDREPLGQLLRRRPRRIPPWRLWSGVADPPISGLLRPIMPSSPFPAEIQEYPRPFDPPSV